MPGSRSTVANPIQPKRRTTDSAAPAVVQLLDGEIAVNVPGRTIYIRDGDEVVPLANYGVSLDEIAGLQASIDGKLGANETALAASRLATARTITIGAGAKSFDGSAGLSWTLAEIGAAAASHAHVIGDVTGLQTALDGKLGTAGTAAAASKLATARSITIGATARTFDGTAGISWTLADIGAAAASHQHAAGDITSGVLAAARLGSGTAGTNGFLRGDNTWSATLFNNFVLSTPTTAAVGRSLVLGHSGGVATDVDGNNYIDFYSANTTDPANYQARFIRWMGANGALDIVQRGSGQVRLYSLGASNIVLGSGNQNKLIYTASTDLWSLGAAFANGFAISGAAGTARRVQYRTGTNTRFDVGLDGAAESGSDAGSNFVFNLLNDAGVSSTTATITRQTGVWSFTQSPTVPTAASGDSSTKAASTAFVQAEFTARRGVANGLASLGADGKLLSSQLPALAITDTFPVASQAAMLALADADVGDVAIRSDVSKTFILRALPASTLANWSEILSPTSGVSSVFGRVGAVTAQAGDYTAAQITQDASNRFVTDAEKAAWNGKQAALGYAPVSRSGDTINGTLTINNNAGSTLLLRTADGSKQVGFGNSYTTSGDGVAFIHNYANTDLAFGTNNTERGRILAAGALSWGSAGITTTGGVTAASFTTTGDTSARRGDFTGRLFVKDSGNTNPGTPTGKSIQLYYMSGALGDHGCIAVYDYTAAAYKLLQVEASAFCFRGNGTTSFGMDIDPNGAYLYGGWFRSYGEAGWYSQTYAGGIHMTDGTYVRVYGGKTMWASSYRVESASPTIEFRDTDAGTSHWIHCNDGQIGFLQNNVFSWAAYRDASNGWGCVGNVYGGASDERLKTNFRPYDPAAIDAAFDAIELELFDWNGLGNEHGFHETDVLGSSAQKMQRAIPAAVTVNHALNPIEGEKPNYLTIMWEKTVPTLIGKVKNQQREIDELKAMVRTLLDRAA